MKQGNMKKFEYRLETYRFKVNNDLASNIEKAFRKEGQNGWELVQWKVMQNPIGVSYLSQFTADTMLILATWKREVAS